MMLISQARLVVLGRAFFGAALLAFGVLQFIYGDFVPGRAPAWPASIPGQFFWAYGSGACLVLSGAAIISTRGARPAAILSGALIFVWALLRHLPALVAHASPIGFTGAGKALALFGGCFAVAASLPSAETTSSGFPSLPADSRNGWSRLGRFCLGAFMILGGIQHFLYARFVATLVPAWIPGAITWTYFAGAALIAGGVGLQLSRTVRLAATLSGMMIFTWVLILHLPRALAASSDASRNEWTALFEAVAFSGIAFVLAGEAPASRDPKPAQS